MQMQGSEICLVLKSRVTVDKSLRKYQTPPTTPSGGYATPPTPFPTAEHAATGSTEPSSSSSSSSPSAAPPSSAPKVAKPAVPTLQLNRAKMFNFE